MLFLTYLRRELHHRLRQAVFIAAGLTVGVGLVITVSAALSGVKNAQATVLHTLYGIGTDMTVTKTWTPGSTPANGGRVGNHAQSLDFLTSSTLGTIKSSAVPSISKLPQVSAAVGVLSLQDTKMTIPAEGPGGSQSGAGTLPLPTQISVDGVDPGQSGIGPLSLAKVTSGRTLRTSDISSYVALADSSYAAQNKLSVGKTITLAKTRFTIVGIVSQGQGADAPNVLVPLATAEKLAGMTGEVNTIYVATASAADITAVSRDITRLVPSATVTTASSLASEITGSLASTADLARDLGIWVAAAVLAAAFALASLMTLAAVTRRVREFGTLKALGWRTRRIVAQVLGESLTVSIAGSLAGVALGIGGAALISALAPRLSAIVAASPGSQEPTGTVIGPTGEKHFTAPGAYYTVPVHFSAPVTLTPIVLAVLLGIAGGLLAGLLGGWRAGRLRPAAALARVE